MKLRFIQSLVVLSWATITVSSQSLTAERIPRHELQSRQNPACRDRYTSLNGMEFFAYCNYNNPFNDALPAFTTPSMDACVEKCSRYWNEVSMEACFGVVWVEEGQQCWLRNGTTSTSNFVLKNGVHSALVKEGVLKGYDEKCPGADQSTHLVPNTTDVQYKVHCNKTIAGQDACFDGVTCNDKPFHGFWHATSLEECLSICIKSHPLCKAVIYSPSMKIGFANCWQKTGFPDTLSPPGSGFGTMHSATLADLKPLNTTCRSDTTYKPGNDVSFDMQCDQSSSSTNMTTIHTKDINACRAACISKMPECVGVLFDSTYASGYENCYLQNTTSTLSDRKGAISSRILSRSLAHKPKKRSLAWIAGPIAGGVVVLGLILAAWFWWRRKRASNKDKLAELGSTEKEFPEANGTTLSEADGAIAVKEVPGDTKFAHMVPTNERPVELPGGTEPPSRPKSPQELPSCRYQ